VGTKGARSVRLTVPLVNTSVIVDGAPLVGRIEVTPRVVLGSLDDSEEARVESALALPQYTVRYRLEIHGHQLRMDLGASTIRNRDAETVIRRHLAMLSCAVRMAPRWVSAVADELLEGRWKRVAWVGYGGGGQRERHANLPSERLRTWGRLLENWPAEGLDARLYLALEYYADSVADFREHPSKSLMSAAIALETLLGGDLLTQIARGLSQRGGLLVARGEEALFISRRLKTWYTARSKLVHGGRLPSQDVVVGLHRFLMRAIPSMAALMQVTGGHEEALRALDEAVFVHVSEVDSLFEAGNRWWDFVPAAAIL
jgi:hypothetical protein